MTQKGSKLVYILAASHSGSTLTAMLLNSHPQMCTAGELKISSLGNEQDYYCSCRQSIEDCEFWVKISSEMQSRGHAFEVRNAQMCLSTVAGRYAQRLIKPLHRGKLLELVRDGMLTVSRTWRKGFSAWADRNRALIESICDAANVEYVVDSSKTGLRLKYLERVTGVQVKVIRLLRDGRAVALTYMDSEHFADAANVDWRGGGTGKSTDQKLSMFSAAARWARSNDEADDVYETILPEDRITISYEDLCTDTEVVMRRIQEFLQVESDSSFKKFKEIEHHVIGNGMRLDTSSAVQLDDRWRDVLTAQDLRDFATVGEAQNRRYGYED